VPSHQAPRSRAPMTKDQLYGDRDGVTVQTKPLGPLSKLSPGRFDRSSAPILKSLSQRRNSIKEKVAQGSERVWCRLIASPSFSPSSRSPLLAPLSCLLLPSFPVPVPVPVPVRARLPSSRGYCCCRCRKRKSLQPCTYLPHSTVGMAALPKIRRAQPYSVQRTSVKESSPSPLRPQAMPCHAMVQECVIGVDAYRTNP
jgi:hypothetical protein